MQQAGTAFSSNSFILKVQSKMSESDGDTIGNGEKQLLQQRLIADLCQETITKLQIFQRGLRLNAPIIAATATSMATATAITTTIPSKKVQPRKQQSKVLAKEKYRKKLQKSNDSSNITINEDHDDDDDDDADMQNMPDERVLNAIKMDNELDALVEMFGVAADEALNAKPSEKTLKQLIATLEANDNEVDAKTKELRQKQARLQFLKAEIETGHKTAAARIQEMEERIANLRHNLRNVRRLNDLEFDLVERWEANRLTQANIVCSNEERALRTEIENLNRQITGETRIIGEVEKFNAKQFDEYRAKIDEWRTKYANEMAKVTAETMEHEKRIMELSKIHERHEQTYAERLEFVREYLEKKAEEQRLYEQQMHRVECAIKLQAWWRGVMVRRGLGPYKKKAKKGKKGKGKAK